MATLVSLVGGLLLPILVFHLYPFSVCADAGVKDPHFAACLKGFERDIADSRNDADSAFDVWVFGDSTHFYRLGPNDGMLATLNRTLSGDLRTEVRFLGFSAGALNIWDYYLLSNAVVEAKPDLVVIGVSLDSFDPYRYNNGGYYRHDHDHFLNLSEYPHAVKLKAGPRKFKLASLLWRRIDYELFGSRLESYFRHGRTTIMRRLSLRWDDVWARLEPAVGFRFGKLRRYPKGSNAKSEPATLADHPFFPIFGRTSEFLNQRGIPVLYYSIQTIEASPGDQPASSSEMHRRFAAIFEIIGRNENVYTLNLAGTGTPSMFSDWRGHLTEAGVKKVARDIADEILRLRENELGG